MIIFFSGTGNSHMAARELGRLLDDSEIIWLKGEILFDPLGCKLATSAERIIWVFPTYSWGVPPVVKRFMTEAEIDGADRAIHYMVTTCGDDIGETASQWKRIIKKRKWKCGYAYSVTMPNTYVLMKGFDVDPIDVSDQKLAEAPKSLEIIAHRIKSNEPGDGITKGSWSKVKSRLIYPWFVKFCMSPKPFKSNGRCIGCGKCAKACPMENISMDENKPQWHNRCALCLRCYHICPCDAVDYGHATKDKGQYFLE